MRRIECRLEFYVELVGLLKPEERWTAEELGKTGLLLKIPVKDQEEDDVLIFVPKDLAVTP